MTEIQNPKQLVFDLIWDLDINAINIRIGGVPVGAAFQPRLNNDDFKAISFRGWKATPTSSCCLVNDINLDIEIWNLPAPLNRHFGLYGICSECELNSNRFTLSATI